MGRFSDMYKEKNTTFSDMYRTGQGIPTIGVATEKKVEPNLATEGELPFQAHALAKASEKPEHVIRSYAQYRFPTLSVDDAAKRYYMKDNEVWYIDNDGTERKEERETGLKKAIEDFDLSQLKGKQLGAATLMETPPAIVGASTQYATGSPWLAAGASGMARSVQTGIAQILAERDPDYKEMLKAGGMEAAAGVVGDFIAKRGISALDNMLKEKSTSKELASLVGKDIEQLKIKEKQKAINETMLIAKQNNISLDMAQVLQSSRVAATQKAILQEGGAGAEVLKEQSAKTADQALTALRRQLKNIAPGAGSRYDVGKEVVETAKLVRESLVDARGALSGPAYTEAFKRQTPVDALPVLKTLDDIIENKVARKTPTSKALSRIRENLLRNAPENHPAVIEIDKLLAEMPAGTKAAAELMKARSKLTSGHGVVEDRLKKLDSAKKDIDRLIKDPASEKISGEEVVHLETVLTDLKKQMDATNPTYKRAREIHQEASGPVDAFDKTILDVVRKLEGDYQIKAPKRIFSSDFSDPTSIRLAKNYIKKVNPRAWDSSVRVFLEQELDQISESMSGRGVVEAFRKKAWKPAMKARMKEALDPQSFKMLDDYMGLVKKLGISIDANSDTAMKQIKREAIKQEAGGKSAAALRTAGKYADLVKLNFREAAEAIGETRTPGFMRDLAVAITSKDKDIVKAINQMKRINPKQEKFMRSMARFVSTLTGRAGYQSAQSDDYSTPEDVIKYLEGPMD